MGKVGNVLFWLAAIVVHFLTVCTYIFVADGSGFFVEILQTHNYIVHEPQRQIAHYITQFPLVWGLNIGITNFRILVLLFALGHCLHVWVSLVMAYWIAGKEHVYRFAAIPLLVLLVCAGFLIGQAFVAASYTLVIALGLLNWQTTSLPKKVVITLVALLSFNVYEGAFINFAALTVIAVYNFTTNKPNKDWVSRFLQIGLVVVIVSYGSFMGFRAVLAPLNAAGQQTIAESDLYFTVFFTVAIALYWFVLRVFAINWVIASILILGSYFFTWYIPETVMDAYTNRLLILLIPTSLILAEWAVWVLKPFIKWNTVNYGIPLVLMLLGLLTFRAIPSYSHQYQVAEFCHNRKGVLQHNEVYLLYYPNYELWWTNIYTSIIYQGFVYGEVNSIAGNPTKCDFCYDVEDYKTYPDLREYGIEYHKSLVP
jgi:hypothetical protein